MEPTELEQEVQDDNNHPIKVTNQSFGECCYMNSSGKCKKLGRNPFSVYLTTLWGLTDTYYCASHRSYAVRLEKTILRDYLRMKEEKLRDDIESHMPELCADCKTSMKDYFIKYAPLVDSLTSLKGDIEEVIVESAKEWDEFAGSAI
jgi:hypothetical protein